MVGNNVRLASGLFGGLWLLLLLTVAVLARLCRGGWSAAIAAGLWWGWVTNWAVFAAGESVTGRWL